MMKGKEFETLHIWYRWVLDVPDRFNNFLKEYGLTIDSATMNYALIDYLVCGQHIDERNKELKT